MAVARRQDRSLARPVGENGFAASKRVSRVVSSVEGLPMGSHARIGEATRRTTDGSGPGRNRGSINLVKARLPANCTSAVAAADLVPRSGAASGKLRPAVLRSFA